jgi:hypothetical protein
MHEASQIRESDLPTATQRQPTTIDPSSRAKPSPSVLDAFWRRMLAMYGHTWASQYGDHASGITAETWASALSGITGPQIAEGLRGCVAEGREFPPGAPRFRAMCLGIPSLPRVKLELSALREHASRLPRFVSGSGGDTEADPPPAVSAFTRLAWSLIDGYGYRHASAKDAGRMLQDAYDLATEQVMRGGDLPQEGAGRIEHQEAPKPVIPETREERIARLAEVLKDEFSPEAVVEQEPRS